MTYLGSWVLSLWLFCFLFLLFVVLVFCRCCSWCIDSYQQRYLAPAWACLLLLISKQVLPAPTQIHGHFVNVGKKFFKTQYFSLKWQKEKKKTMPSHIKNIVTRRRLLFYLCRLWEVDSLVSSKVACMSVFCIIWEAVYPDENLIRVGLLICGSWIIEHGRKSCIPSLYL